MNRLLGLELLRGVAATLVLLEHLRYVVPTVCGPAVALPWAIDRFDGYWGVDIFFVLSGYLIGLTLDKPGTTARSFLLARFARVLPLYVVVTACCLAIPSLRTADISVPMLVTSATLLPLAGDALSPLTAHPYGWTLCFEMSFYVVATAVAAVVGARNAAAVLIGVYTLAPAALTAFGPFAGWAFPSFAASPLTAEFALGLVAFRLTARLPSRAGWALLAIAGAQVLVGCLDDYCQGVPADILANPLRAWTRVGRFGLPAFLGVLGVACLDRAGAFRSVGRFARLAGSVSYPLYLIQSFTLPILVAFAPPLGLDRAWPVAVTSVALSLLLAAAVTRCVDQPLHALAKGWAKRLSTPRQPSSASSFWTFASIKSRTLR